MTVEISPETERLVQEEIRRGHFQSVDELIVEGVRAWRETVQAATTQKGRKSPAEAIAHIREVRQGICLSGLTARDLMNEGRP